jgi:hypothetical protein
MVFVFAQEPVRKDNLRTLTVSATLKKSLHKAGFVRKEL